MTRPSETKVRNALRTWTSVVAELSKLTEQELEMALTIERNRSTVRKDVMKRLHRRLCRLRYLREVASC